MENDQIKQVEDHLFQAITLEGVQTPSLSLQGQMEHLIVPGVSIAVIDNGEIAWAKGYGHKAVDDPAPITNDTFFQACSISKAVTGMAAMALVQQGLLSLDDDVNEFLKNWKVPQNEFTQEKKVTLRRLLTHSAGTSITGFKGYQRGQPMPDVTQILDGLPPANTPAVRVVLLPGTRFVYSGGGYTIIQQLLMDVTGLPFSQLMKELIFEPLGMLDSLFEHPLPRSLWGREAAGHRVNGSLLAGKWLNLPELAAAGLWTTSVDLARFAIGIQQAIQGISNSVMTQETARQMTSPQFQNWGLGPGVGGEGTDSFFYHSGGNQGYRCEMAAFRFRGQGAVVMTNSDNGTNLSLQVIRAVAHAYQWPHFQSQPQKAISLDEDFDSTIAGRYQSMDDPQSQAWITVEQGKAYVEVPILFPSKFRIYPQSKHKYFDLENGYRFIFTQEGDDMLCEAFMFDQIFRSKKVEPIGGNHV